MISKNINDEDSQLTQVFSAISDPTRRRIMTLLTRDRQTVVGLAKNFSMSLPAVSKHIKILEKSGLITRQIEGRTHYLQIEATPLKQASNWIEFYEQFWNKQLDALEEFINEDQDEEDQPKEKKS